jgi:hypothetical protein
MLAAEFAVLHELQSVGVIFLVFLCVVISLLALGAGESNLDASVISHLAAPPMLIYLIEQGSIRVPPSERCPSNPFCGRRIEGAICTQKMGTKKKPFDRGRVIIPQIPCPVNRFFQFFCHFPLFFSSKREKGAERRPAIKQVRRTMFALMGK